VYRLIPDGFQNKSNDANEDLQQVAVEFYESVGLSHPVAQTAANQIEPIWHQDPKNAPFVVQ
jgi:hypothetical protein